MLYTTQTLVATSEICSMLSCKTVPRKICFNKFKMIAQFFSVHNTIKLKDHSVLFPRVRKYIIMRPNCSNAFRFNCFRKWTQQKLNQVNNFFFHFTTSKLSGCTYLDEKILACRISITVLDICFILIMCLCEGMCTRVQVLTEERDIRSPRTGVTGNWSYSTWVLKQTQVLGTESSLPSSKNAFSVPLILYKRMRNVPKF